MLNPPRLHWIGTSAAAVRLYAEILEPSFPAAELIGADEFATATASGTFEVLAAREGEAYLGAIVGQRYGAAYLVHWLAVGGAGRGGGTGSALVAAGVARWLADPRIGLVLAEVERPDLFAAHPSYGDPARRLAFYARRGAVALDLPYYQPPAAAGLPRVRNLLLTVLAARNSAAAPRLLDAEEAAAVRTVLLATMGRPQPGDVDTRRVFQAVEDPRGVRVLPLTDYRNVPILGPEPNPG